MTVTHVLLVVYAVVLMGAGLWVTRRVRRSGDFFVAGRALPAGVIFATLLAANIGAGSTVGATGLGYREGLSAWWWSGSAAIGCLVLGLFVAPRMHRLATRARLLHGGRLPGVALRPLGAGPDRRDPVGGDGGAALGADHRHGLGLRGDRRVAAAAGGPPFSGLILTVYFSGGGLMASAWVNLLQLATLVVGFGLAVPYAWSAAGGWAGLRAAAGPEMAGQYGSLTGMGLAGILGLVVVFVPSFIVSPGLIQKRFGARTARGAGRAALGNAAGAGGVRLRAGDPGDGDAGDGAGRSPTRRWPCRVSRWTCCPPGWAGWAWRRCSRRSCPSADAILFMLSTSLSRDLYQAVLRPEADDAQLLRVGRAAAVAGGVLGLVLALVLPSVMAALKLFYGIMTAALFVPLLVGLSRPAPEPGHARVAVVASVVGTGLGLWVLAGTAHGSWAPSVLGMGLAVGVFATAWLGVR